MAESLRDAIAAAPCLRPGYSECAPNHKKHAECAADAAFEWLRAHQSPCARCHGKGTESWQVSRNPAEGREDWPCVRCKGSGLVPTFSALAALADALTKENP